MQFQFASKNTYQNIRAQTTIKARDELHSLEFVYKETTKLFRAEKNDETTNEFEA